MVLYLFQPRSRIFVKIYRFLPFAKTMGKNIGKNISKNLSVKYSQKRLDQAKPSARDALETASKRAIQKTADATGDFIGNKIADKITKAWETSQQNNSETVSSMHDGEIPKEIHISPHERRWYEINIMV